MQASTLRDCIPDYTADLSLAEMESLARSLNPSELVDTLLTFDGDHYVRRTLFKSSHVEIAAIWFSKGQTSSVHDHRGSRCVVRVLRGRILESTFEKNGAGQLSPLAHQCIERDQVSGVEGWTIHHVANLDERGSVLLNVYSPPFAT